eukprot:1437470-Pyramimonas_sp.AAC.1
MHHALASGVINDRMRQYPPPSCAAAMGVCGRMCGGGGHNHSHGPGGKCCHNHGGSKQRVHDIEEAYPSGPL